MTVEPFPDWLIPPAGGFTVEDFLELRGLPKHTELIDGGLVFVSPREMWHSRAVSVLWRDLDQQTPPDLYADREMAVKLGPRQMPEPDVLVVSKAATRRAGGPSTYYFAEDVVLAVEAVSPDSEERDRETKPAKYAKAGISNYWRVERRDDEAVVYVYELDPATATYGLVGIFHDRLKINVPFPIDIDLTSIWPRD
ncbi:Uma2 family endonuclease [Nocardia sp. CA-120079]|uniref:Uma2 family endonuclease n=1 Tax=Nocardia sp. CA-120079 TaxID=3239974 RepID=UPI003D974CFE